MLVRRVADALVSDLAGETEETTRTDALAPEIVGCEPAAAGEQRDGDVGGAAATREAAVSRGEGSAAAGSEAVGNR